MSDWALLFAGVVLAGAGGESFVRGAIGLAVWARLAPGIIGATVAAFATSSPELSVAVTSGLNGTPGIALGNSLGANVTNITLILGIALCIGPIRSMRDSIRRDLPVAILVPMVLGVMVLDGVVSRVDAALLLGLFLAWTVAVVIEVRRQRSIVPAMLGEPKRALAVAFALGGLVLLVVAGRVFVLGAEGVARTYGLDGFVIGATIVALGTTIPELATVVVAKLRGRDEMGVGIILGSNIFNGLCVVGVAAAIHPIEVGWRAVVSVIIFGLASVALTVPSASGVLERRRGVLLLAVYVAYLVLVLRPSGV